MNTISCHKASGFQPVREFTKGIKHKKNRARILDLQEDQGWVLSAWNSQFTPKVDINRINWKGLLVSSRPAARPTLQKAPVGTPDGVLRTPSAGRRRRPQFVNSIRFTS